MLAQRLVDEKQLLLENHFAPITSEIGFIAAPRDEVVRAYMAWQGPLQLQQGVQMDTQLLTGGLPSVLSALEPLVKTMSSKSLFLPTANGWTAYVDNLGQGTDAEAVILCVARALNCIGIKMVAAPHTITKEQASASGAYGGLAFQLFEPQKSQDLSYARMISLINDAGRWEFTSIGDILDFEDVKAYKQKSKVDRFTFAHLMAYLSAFGVSAFTEQFYCTRDPGALLVKKRGAGMDTLETVSLRDVRRSLGIAS